MASTTASEGQVDIGRQQQHQQGTSEARNVEYLPEGSSWRRLLERSSSLARPIRGSNYVQLATVDGDGRPKCRTVVFRGFLSHHQDLLRSVWNESSMVCDGLPCILKMTTDARSRKVDQVTNQQSAAELVWWFPNSNEQFRIAGEVAFVGGGQSGGLMRAASGTDYQASRTLNTNPVLQQERERMWKSLSDAARESFVTDAVPGHAYIPPSGATSPDTAVGVLDSAQSGIDDPPDSFLLMLLVPRSVDYLRLTNMYRQVDTIDDGVWTNVRVNP
jgi:pyridoxamine 5'-phosphate oxidase